MNVNDDLPQIGCPSPVPVAGDAIVITSRIEDPAFRRGEVYVVDRVVVHVDGTVTVHLVDSLPLKSELGDRWHILGRSDVGRS